MKFLFLTNPPLEKVEPNLNNFDQLFLKVEWSQNPQFRVTNFLKVDS
jgi:hypothetical protein